MLLPVILAGGSGSRLWPLSRELMPKQFLRLQGDCTLLQSTLRRLQALNAAKPLVICNEEHRFIAAEQLRQLQLLDHNILLEPVGRNTAPAIAAAALYSLQQGDDAVLLVLPADHQLADSVIWQQAVAEGMLQASKNQLVTFGIMPRYAETAYGYIVPGDSISDTAAAYQIKRFTEKPSLAEAEALLSAGNVYWNSGIFMFKASVFLKELQRYRPAMYQQCQKALVTPQADLDFVRLDHAAFAQCAAESVDYAVMEHSNAAVVIPMATNWSDLGSWSSLWQLSDKDQQGNAHHGQVLAHNSSNNYVYAETGLVATVGLTDTVVIQTKDAVLVAAKDQVQQVNAIVQQLKSLGGTEYRSHRQVFRPWGNYDVIDQGVGYQVKRIRVLPGEALSLQSHQHRAEHWIVVAGTAQITIDGTDTLLQANQSVYIPPTSVHALANPTAEMLELIEVQTGAYISEDDIVRYYDRYGRVQTDPA